MRLKPHSSITESALGLAQVQLGTESGTKLDLAQPSGPTLRRADRMSGFMFRLETVDGAPTHSSTISAAVPD